MPGRCLAEAAGRLTVQKPGAQAMPLAAASSKEFQTSICDPAPGASPRQRSGHFHNPTHDLSTAMTDCRPRQTPTFRLMDRQSGLAVDRSCLGIVEGLGVEIASSAVNSPVSDRM